MLPGCFWFDTGRRRCVSGPEEHQQRMTEALALVGLQPLKVMKQEQLILGDAPGLRHLTVLLFILLFRTLVLRDCWIWHAFQFHVQVSFH